MQKKVADFIDANRANLRPQPVGVALARSLEPSLAARGVYFAMNGLASRLTLNDTLRYAPAGVDRGTIERTYADVAGAIPGDTRPSGEAQDRAKEWLNH